MLLREPTLTPNNPASNPASNPAKDSLVYLPSYFLGGFFRQVFFLTFSVLLLLPLQSHAQLRIDIHEGTFRPISLGIPDISHKGFSAKRVSLVRNLVESDLRISGLVRIVARDSFLYNELPLEMVPNFASFRIAGADAVLSLYLHKSKGFYRATLQIWDIQLQRPLAREDLEDRSLRVLSHKISDTIYHRLTGESGYFNSRILYVSEVLRGKRLWKRLAIMNYDGTGRRFLTKNRRTLVLNPRFSSDGKRAIYTALTRKSSSIRLLEISRNKRETILPLGKGLVYAARFAPNGKSIIYAQSLSGNSEIFTYDLSSGRRRRLTVNRAIDTSPSFSPEGDYISFVSDRSGRPQIYTMTRNGRNIQRVSFAEGSFSTPVWSPRGDKIAFTRQLGGRFAVGVMNIDGTNLRILSEGFRVEGPSWSPNGRVLVFFRKNRTPKGTRIGYSRLVTVDVTGRFARELSTPHNAYDPHWSYAR